MGTREWESLPPELLYLISGQVQTLQDSIRFSCVSKSWRSVSDSAILNIFNKNLPPLLIVPYDKGDGHKKKERKRGSTICDDTLGIISLFHGDDNNNNNQLKRNKKVYKLYLPEIENRRICGCSKGWLVTFHENSEVQLLNPITRVLVPLPPVTTLPEIVGTVVSEEKGLCYRVNHYPQWGMPELEEDIDSHSFRQYFLEKVVTNTDANSTLPTLIMAIYGSGILAFCRPSRPGADNRWISCFEEDSYKYNRNSYHDITFYNGRFYAVEEFGSLVLVKDLYDNDPYTITIIEALDFPDKNYLVECSSCGNLLKVARHLTKKEENRPYRTIEFKVSKLEFNEFGCVGYYNRWVEVTNLGEDCALFVGYNHSFSFSASKFPGCKGNCIYFTDLDDHLPSFYKRNDVGVYNLEDGSFETLYETSSQLLLPPPIWYELKNKNGFVEHNSNS